ncbi:MAG: hypothetical protein LBK22_10555 [Tannerella sp.]|jgi:hypothetical protein|nr:hypothetical protein [Tannerella sp.]
MKTGKEKSKRAVLLVAFLCLFAGCNGSNGEEPAEEIDIENSEIYFKDFTVESVQRLVKGKWLLISETDFSGKPRDMASDSLYAEFADAKTFRSNYFNLSREMKEYKVTEWKRNSIFGYAVEMVYAENEDVVNKPSYILSSLLYGILSYREPGMDGPVWEAVRVDEEQE